MEEQILNRSFIQKQSTQNPQYFVCTLMQFKFMLYNCHQTICSNSRVYLDSYSRLSSPPKGFNLEMLLNPLKELMRSFT